MYASAHNVQCREQNCLNAICNVKHEYFTKLLVQNKYWIEFSNPILASLYVTPEDECVHCKQNQKNSSLHLFFHLHLICLLLNFNCFNCKYDFFIYCFIFHCKRNGIPLSDTFLYLKTNCSLLAQ